jgi:methionyl-tRNA formyltransferase
LKNIIVATIKEWNIQNYFSLKKSFSDAYNFHLMTNHEELTYENILKLNPEYIFFPHWSWYIDRKIFENFECIVFHETDLPFGRGGSPIQNLIQRGIYDTKISALKVTEELDAGDIYLKQDFSLKKGSIEELLSSISKVIFEDMIPTLLRENITPKKQSGKVTTFKRRSPAQSDILSLQNRTFQGVYDFVRMLDGEGYPKAYLELENIKIIFHKISKEGKSLCGAFEVVENE